MKQIFHRPFHNTFYLSILFIGILSSLAADDKKAITKENCLSEGVCHQIFQEGDHVYVAFRNRNKDIPISIEMEVKDSLNLRVDSLHKDIIVVRGGETGVSTKFLIQDIHSRWSISYPFRFYYGSIEDELDDEYVYRLPYEGKFLLSQGYLGLFTHMTKYALDFAMPEKSPILAARPGVVVGTADHFTEGKNDISYINKANYITILHEDGSVGQYFHLFPRGVFVKKGDFVQRGQKIGISGNTGYSSLPHLHFEVSKIFLDNGKLVEKTFPTYFQTESDNKTFLDPDNYYWHEDIPMREVPFVSEEGISICRSYTKDGSVKDCHFRVKQSKDIVVGLQVWKRAERKYEFQVTQKNERDVLLQWSIDAKQEWNQFYTYISASRLSPGKYSLYVLAEGKEVGPVDFVVEK